MPTYVYVIEDRGVIVAASPEAAEHILRDLWKNVEPWLNTPKIEVEWVSDDVRL